MMKLIVVCSGSKGNSYVLTDGSESLVLDCGCKSSEILAAVDYKLKNIKGALLTHEHKDHILSWKHLKTYGIKVYGNKELAEKLGCEVIPDKKSFTIGGFVVTPLYIPHTTRSPTGELEPCANYAYIIKHKDMGTLFYATDFEYLPYTFYSWAIEHWLIECNHMDIVSRASNENKFEHVLKGHSSLSTVAEIVKKNKHVSMMNIVLCHLSKENADPEKMVQTIQDVAGNRTNVCVAKRGLVLELSKLPF